MKNELIDLLDDIRSVNHMIDLHSVNPDKISNFMVSQYRDIRRKAIKEFNTITNGKNKKIR